MRKLLIIIGSAKCGTSSLNAWLGSHPAFVAGQQKEPRFFTDFHLRTWQGPATEGFTDMLIPNSDPEAYRANFPDLGEDQWAIDASTDYIWCETAPELIAKAAETMEVRLIAVLRDPVARAISEYNHTLRSGWETLSFGASLEAEEARIADGYHPLFYHKRRSTVLEDVRRYKAAFGDRFMVLDYAELADPDAIMRRICTFIGVPHHPVEPGENKNTSRLPRNALAEFMLQSPALQRIGRTLVPAELRRTVWNAMHTSSRKVKTVTEAEKDTARRLLAEEIAACEAAPEIPTDHWQKALITSEQ